MALVGSIKAKVPVKRMVFREITKEAVQNALENTRDIDMNLVYAQDPPNTRSFGGLYGFSFAMEKNCSRTFGRSCSVRGG